MTSPLERAMRAANERKTASVGEGEGIVVAGGELQDRAVFSGFDIGYDELVGTSQSVADVFHDASAVMGLRALFVAAWCDGLLTGLLMASLPPTNGTGITDDTGPEGES